MPNDKLTYKYIMLEALDVPPAHIQHQSGGQFSPTLINYMKQVENGVKSGYKHGKWYPYSSYEGGNDTIGFGHKLTKQDGNSFSNGISDKDAEKLLINDLEIAKGKVYSDIKHMFKVQIPQLEQDKEEMLIDFAFNLKGGLRTFPHFVRAVLTNDWKTAAKEYKRTATSKDGHKTELGRNKVFFQTFIQPHLK